MRSLVNAALGALAFTIITAGTAVAQGGGKIAYVNSQEIIAAAPGRAEAEAQIQKDMNSYRAQVQKMGDSLNALIASYTKSESTLSESARAAKQKEIQDKEKEYQQRVQGLEQQAQQRQAELIRPIMEKINNIIEQVRAEDGYAMVFDAGNQAGVVVAADSTLDITDKVISRLKAASGSASTKPANKGPTSQPTGATRKNPPVEH
ncbi:MAG TPA: OmpH family outer membrane protein [Gemmatimonadaceae bacterium]|jgi:outer membrane protein|nr:OmpH family outer membrane protein [Gemmatimonadaceae bacterium]